MTEQMTRCANPIKRRDHRRGFTLIELVVAMGIAAMLAAIAIPAYSSYVRKARRTEAKTVLLNLASMEERFFSTQNHYTDQADQLGYPPGWPVTTDSAYYQIAQPAILAAAAPTAASPGGAPATYTFIATALGDQANDTQCVTFSIDQQGTQKATKYGGADNSVYCWR